MNPSGLVSAAAKMRSSQTGGFRLRALQRTNAFPTTGIGIGQELHIVVQLAILQLQNCVGYVGAADDGISLECTSSSPTADFHDHALCDSSSSHVSRSRSSEIVEEQIGSPSVGTCSSPSPSEIREQVCHSLEIGRAHV